MRERTLGTLVWPNLDDVLLYGFEKYKSSQTVSELVRAIEKNANFPPVPVPRVGDKYPKEYHLVYNPNRNLVPGGHNRAYAHWIAKKPLKCVVVSPSLKNLYIPEYEKVLIKEIQLRDDPEDLEWRLYVWNLNYSK